MWFPIFLYGMPVFTSIAESVKGRLAMSRVNFMGYMSRDGGKGES